MCRVVEAQMRRALYSFLYEGMTNPEASESFLRGGGFCPRHFRAATRLGVNRWAVGVVEIGILSERLMRRASEELSAAGKPGEWKNWRRLGRRKRGSGKPPFPGRDCMFCRERSAWEENSAAALEELTADAEFAAAIERNGLCLRHGQMGLEGWRGRKQREWLAALLERTAARLRAELGEFLRKYDYRFSHEAFGPEGDVVRRALEFLAGTEEGEQP